MRKKIAMKFQWNSRFLLALVVLYSCSFVNAQETADSLTYKRVVSEVLKRNPLIKQADEKVNGSIWKEKLSQSSYLPVISANGSVTRLYPVPEFELNLPNPQTGEMVSKHLQMVPDIGMDYGFKITQLLYDFGKTKDNFGLQQENTALNKIGVQQLKQRLSLLTANYFYTLVYIQAAIGIKSEELNTLQQHLDFVENKQKTGSATQYEVLSTKVRISITETQLTELKSSAETQFSHLNNLMDTTNLKFSALNEFNTIQSIELSDSVNVFAYTHRDEIAMAEKKIALSEWNYKIANSQNKPVLLFLGSTGFKNGYLPEVNALKFNYMIGLSLNVPIFDGNRRHINKQITASAINESKFELENLKNGINDELKENFVALQLAFKKINQYKIQQEQALEAYNHAQANFKAGAITNLDLLDASNALSESKLLLLKAEIDYKLYEIKYKAALGERLYE